MYLHSPRENVCVPAAFEHFTSFRVFILTPSLLFHLTGATHACIKPVPGRSVVRATAAAARARLGHITSVLGKLLGARSWLHVELGGDIVEQRQQGGSRQPKQPLCSTQGLCP